MKTIIITLATFCFCLGQTLQAQNDTRDPHQNKNKKQDTVGIMRNKDRQIDTAYNYQQNRKDTMRNPKPDYRQKEDKPQNKNNSKTPNQNNSNQKRPDISEPKK